MNSAVLDHLSDQHDVMPLLGLPTEQPAKRELTPSVDGVLRSIGKMMRALILGVLKNRTRDEFLGVLPKVFPDYVRLVRSFSEIAGTIPPQVIARVSVESFDELEGDLRLHGEESFGPEMTERALFTVFTLRKITPLLYSIATSKRKLDDGDLEKDGNFAQNFLANALIARFSVDCLIVAMENNRTIYPEVLGALNDLMRSVVNAYAWAQQAAELRTDKQQFDPEAAFPPLDDDDRQLLRESMRDLSLGEV